MNKTLPNWYRASVLIGKEKATNRWPVLHYSPISCRKATHRSTVGRRPVALHRCLQKIERQGVDHSAMLAGHRFGAGHSVEDSLLGRLGGGTKKAGHRIGGEHPHRGDLVVLADMV